MKARNPSVRRHNCRRLVTQSVDGNGLRAARRPVRPLPPRERTPVFSGKVCMTRCTQCEREILEPATTCGVCGDVTTVRQDSAPPIVVRAPEAASVAPVAPAVPVVPPSSPVVAPARPAIATAPAVPHAVAAPVCRTQLLLLSCRTQLLLLSQFLLRHSLRRRRRPRRHSRQCPRHRQHQFQPPSSQQRWQHRKPRIDACSWLPCSSWREAR